jgi:hypothetical protein
MAGMGGTGGGGRGGTGGSVSTGGTGGVIVPRLDAGTDARDGAADATDATNGLPPDVGGAELPRDAALADGPATTSPDVAPPPAIPDARDGASAGGVLGLDASRDAPLIAGGAAGCDCGIGRTARDGRASGAGLWALAVVPLALLARRRRRRVP